VNAVGQVQLDRAAAMSRRPLLLPESAGNCFGGRCKVPRRVGAGRRQAPSPVVGKEKLSSFMLLSCWAPTCYFLQQLFNLERHLDLQSFTSDCMASGDYNHLIVSWVATRTRMKMPEKTCNLRISLQVKGFRELTAIVGHLRRCSLGYVFSPCPVETYSILCRAMTHSCDRLRRTRC